MDVSVVIPAYREEENLKILLPRLTATLSGMSVRYEILVVDALEKTDATEEVCRAQRVRYLRREGSNDYGDAVRTGIKRSAGRQVIIMDADGSHEPESVADLYSHAGRCDVIIGSRYVRDGKTENNPILLAMSLLVNAAYRLLLDIKVKDVSNSFRMYDGDQLRALDITCRNFDVVEEILVKLALGRPELTVMEIPVRFKKRMFGASKRELLKLVFSYLKTLRRLLRLKYSARSV